MAGMTHVENDLTDEMLVRQILISKIKMSCHESSARRQNRHNDKLTNMSDLRERRRRISE